MKYLFGSAPPFAEFCPCGQNPPVSQLHLSRCCCFLSFSLPSFLALTLFSSSVPGSPSPGQDLLSHYSFPFESPLVRWISPLRFRGLLPWASPCPPPSAGRKDFSRALGVAPLVEVRRPFFENVPNLGLRVESSTWIIEEHPPLFHIRQTPLPVSGRSSSLWVFFVVFFFPPFSGTPFPLDKLLMGCLATQCIAGPPLFSFPREELFPPPPFSVRSQMAVFVFMHRSRRGWDLLPKTPFPSVKTCPSTVVRRVSTKDAYYLLSYSRFSFLTLLEAGADTFLLMKKDGFKKIIFLLYSVHFSGFGNSPAFSPPPLVEHKKCPFSVAFPPLDLFLLLSDPWSNQRPGTCHALFPPSGHLPEEPPATQLTGFPCKKWRLPSVPLLFMSLPFPPF